MATLEELINTKTEELESLTDEQLFEKFKDIFVLEPAVEEKEESDDEDKSSVVETKVKPAKRTTKKKSSNEEIKALLLSIEQDIKAHNEKKLKEQQANGTNQATAPSGNPTANSNPSGPTS